MNETQIEIIDRLKSNDCNISDGIDGLCRLDDYHDFLKDPDFAAGVAEAKQKRHDKVLAALMELVAAGDKTAITDYQRMERQAGDATDARQIKKEFMRVCVELADSKGRCLKEYCEVFNASAKAADKQYDCVVAEFNLTTPYERAKQAQKIHKASMSSMFDEGKLSEVEMYSRMLSKALHDTEASEYPSERSRARADVISINQRLEEIQERERKEGESDSTKLPTLLKAFVMQTSVSEIEILDKKVKLLASGELDG